MLWEQGKHDISRLCVFQFINRLLQRNFMRDVRSLPFVQPNCRKACKETEQEPSQTSRGWSGLIFGRSLVQRAGRRSRKTRQLLNCQNGWSASLWSEKPTAASSKTQIWVARELKQSWWGNCVNTSKTTSAPDCAWYIAPLQDESKILISLQLPREIKNASVTYSPSDCQIQATRWTAQCCNIVKL